MDKEEFEEKQKQFLAWFAERHPELELLAGSNSLIVVTSRLWEKKTCAECGYCLGIKTTETGTTKKPGYPTPVTMIHMDFDCIKYDRQWRETKQIGEHADEKATTEPRKACPSLKPRKLPDDE